MEATVAGGKDARWLVNAQVSAEQTIEGRRWRRRTRSAGKEGNEVEDKAKQKEQPPPCTKHCLS